eukprot:gene9951-13385_t
MCVFSRSGNQIEDKDLLALQDLFGDEMDNYHRQLQSTTAKPTASPSIKASKTPTPKPSTRKPSSKPSAIPIGNTGTISNTPTVLPSANPSTYPSIIPSTSPSSVATFLIPTALPSTLYPVSEPSFIPSNIPTTLLSVNSSAFPTTSFPSYSPTASNTFAPTSRPSSSTPTVKPTASPSFRPTSASPTPKPSPVPTCSPTTATPTSKPSTAKPTVKTTVPTSNPTTSPTCVPTSNPTTSPTCTPTSNPTTSPTVSPSSIPSVPPTGPSAKPSSIPSSSPTSKPSNPTAKPSTTTPTSKPTPKPSAPTARPSNTPTSRPTTLSPTPIPSAIPTVNPTSATPTISPSNVPTASPTVTPLAAFPVCANLKGNPLVFSKDNVCQAYNIALGLYNKLTFTDQIQLAHFYGVVVRLAFHDAGEVDINSADLAGPDGCMAIQQDNFGLFESTSPIMIQVETIFQKVCQYISRADFWIMFAKFVIEDIVPAGTPMLIKYQYGRKDSTSCMAGVGRLPSAQGNLNTIRNVFVNRMGLTMLDAVTLLGAHSLGHVDPSRSGYGLNNASTDIQINAWDASPTQLSIQYYEALVSSLNKWINILQPGSTTTNIWVPVNDQRNVMLNTDMAIAFPIESATIGESIGDTGEICSASGVVNGGYGCLGSDKVSINNTIPSTLSMIQSLIRNDGSGNPAFYNQFAISFRKMACAGYGVPQNIDGATASGKLGTLTAVVLENCPISFAPTSKPTKAVRRNLNEEELTSSTEEEGLSNTNDNNEVIPCHDNISIDISNASSE